MDFALTNKTRSKIPRIPWRQIKRGILGKKYNLSLVLTGEKTIINVSKRYLKKDKATTILAFPLSRDEGEILLCPSYIKKEAKKNFKSHAMKLFIHGLLHLKGFRHGKKMEKEEKKFRKIMNERGE